MSKMLHLFIKKPFKYYIYNTVTLMAYILGMALLGTTNDSTMRCTSSSSFGSSSVFS